MFAKAPRITAILLVGPCALFLTPSAVGQTEPQPTAPVPEEAVPEGLSKGDWASIRGAYYAGRHAAYSVEGGFEARNPGQRWRTHFDGRGFLTVPDAGGWTWGLELERYGFAGSEREVTSPARVSTEGGRVAYTWDATLEEWYVNDTRGLEHGYTVHHRPERDEQDGESPLTFTLAVSGDLRPEVTAGGRGVRFVNEGGAVVLTYTGLSVFDADGRELEASFEATGDGKGRLRLSVDERGARYPLVIDPIAQQAYLKASNTDASDAFGGSVAVSGDTVVVGAFGEDSNATGVDGDQSDNSAYRTGAAYVFARSGTSWSQEAYLKASNADWGDLFGWSVAVSDNALMVGALWEDSNAMGVNVDQSDNSAANSGAAYVFDLSLGTTYCTATPNSTGAPAAISASGSASVAANNVLLVAEPVPSQPGIFFYGPQQASVPFGNGTLCIAGQIGRLDVVNASSNVMTFLLDNTSPPSAATQITAGSTWNFQAWFRDPVAGGAFYDLSNGLSVVFLP